MEGHILKFILIQDLDFREIARRVPGKHVTYGSVDILRSELSEIEMKHYYRDQRTRRTIMLPSTDKNAGYANPTRKPASWNLYRAAHLPHETTM